MNSVSTAMKGCCERRSTRAWRSSDSVIRGWISMSLAEALAAPSRVDKEGVGSQARGQTRQPVTPALSRGLPAFHSWKEADPGSSPGWRLQRMTRMHAYRTHNCAELRASDVGKTVRLSGWVHRKRDHGQLLFVDLRDHYGITQIVTDTESPAFETLDRLRVESVVTVDGEVVARSKETVNPNLPTGEIEVRAGEVN